MNTADLQRQAALEARHALASRLAPTAYELGVRELRLSRADSRLILTALVDELDMEIDLALQRRFSEIASSFPGIEWELRTRLISSRNPEDDGELLPL